jgi:hypothetical protein
MTWQAPVRRVVAVASSLSFFTACYAQQPLTTLVPAPATRVVAQLTDSGVVTMAGAIGPSAAEVEGVIAEANADTWTLHLVRVEQRGGVSTTWNREPVRFPRSVLTNVRERKLDRNRSWFAAGIVAAAAVAVALLFGPVLGGGGGDSGPIEPT